MDDEVNGVPQNHPAGQAPQGIYIKQPEKKRKKLSKKQLSQREKKIKHNLDIKLGLLPPNTPPKRLTEEESIEYQQRLVNIKNINISRSGARGDRTSCWNYFNVGRGIAPAAGHIWN